MMSFKKKLFSLFVSFKNLKQKKKARLHSTQMNTDVIVEKCIITVINQNWREKQLRSDC